MMRVRDAAYSVTVHGGFHLRGGRGIETAQARPQRRSGFRLPGAGALAGGPTLSVIHGSELEDCSSNALGLASEISGASRLPAWRGNTTPMPVILITSGLDVADCCADPASVNASRMITVQQDAASPFMPTSPNPPVAS